MADTVKAPFRIAIRAEGNMVNAYLAAPDTMAEATPIGSIVRSACDADRALFEDFKALMQKVVAAACHSALGVVPADFETSPAPEHERSGRG